MNRYPLKIQLLKSFHWLLASLFAIVWLSGDDWMKVHNLAGYGILIMSSFFILKRILNGQFAQCSRPAFEFKWLKSNLNIMILVSLVLATISGVSADSSGKHSWEDIHEGLAHITLVLAGSHIALKLLSPSSKTILTKHFFQYDYLQRGYHFMNHPIFNKSYHWLLTKWQRVTILWKQNSGKNIFQRAALVVISLLYVVVITSIFLAILPVILVSAILLALLFSAKIKNYMGPVTINVKPDKNNTIATIS